MSPLTRRASLQQRIISPQRAIVAIALVLSTIAINWESVALRVGYAQGGLVAAFNFDEGSGAIVADASGLGNHGVITGATWSTTAKYGKALSFTNDNQYVTISDLPSLDLGAFTLEAWVRPSSASKGRPVIVKELVGGPAYGLSANDASAARPAAWARIAGVSTSAVSGSRLFTGVWTHLAATYNGATLRLYVNGVSVGSRAVTGPLDTSDLPLRIGGSLVRGEYFRGLIDDVRVYNRSLTAQEIQADMLTPVSADDTVPPQVAFTEPFEGATLSSAVTLVSTATDNRGVAGVQFYLDGAPLGADDTTAPYTLTWDTGSAANGAHLLTATARDAAGNTASADITVIVDNPPRLVILQPPSGATINGSTIDISYTTHQPTVEVHHVHFILDGGSTRMDLSFDGSYQVGGVASGVHTLDGYLARSDHSKIPGSDATPVSFTNVVPDTAPPSVAMVLPAADATLAGAVIVRAEAADDTGVAGVQFLLDGLVIGAEDHEAPYEMAFDSAAAVNGLHTISARARDAAGNEAVSAAVTFTIANAPPPDTEPPSVAVTSPAANDTVTGSVTLRADASDNEGVAGVQFLLDGLSVGSEDREAPYELAWDSSTVTNGPHLISATARDAAGNPGIAAAVSVTIENIVEPPPDTAPPVVAIVLPVADAAVSGAVILRAEASDDVGVAAVQFLLDGSVLGAEDAEAPFEMAWDSTAIGNGSHTLSARARDAAGNTSVSSPVGVRVNNADVVAPSVAITAPAAAATIVNVGTLRADASDNVGVAGVQFLVDGVAVGNEDPEAPYEINWDSKAVANGPHTVSARARDAAGNTTVSAVVNVTVANADLTAPSVAIIAPTANATVVDVVTLSATASDNIEVAGVQFLVDGVAVGVEDSSVPYDLSWDSKTVTDGVHMISARARDAAGNTTVSTVVNVTVANPDIAAPSVMITQPAASATLVNVVTLGATAADNIGVAGVQFLVDGLAVGAEDTSAPFSISWDSNAAANGPHTVTARARDAAGNVAVSAAVNVTVANVATGPAAIGEWSDPISIPVVAIHQALMPTGQVLMWDAADFTTAPPILWDPQTATFQNIGATATDLFCAGHAMLANGKLLVVGGDTRTTGLGVFDVNLFDPQTEAWSTAPRMASRRWYPTATTMSDGRVFVLSGYDACYGPSCLVGRAEVYNPVANSWSTLPTTANYVSPSYPFLFEMPDGRVIHAGSYEGTTDTRALDLTTNTWSVLDSNPIDAGSAVMYAPGKIMKAGKWANSDPPFVAAHGNTYVIDLDQPSPKWRSTAPMTHARAYNMLTLLPDGSTLATAGSRNTDPGSAANGVLEAEIWSPVTETWTSMAPMQNARMYHGSSMLLPDGRVLVAGSGRYGSPEQFNAEIYSPPYLFKGARPVITSAPAVVAPGQSFAVGTADTNISAVTMLRIGAMTHSFNSDQRFMSLSFMPRAGSVEAQVPGNVHVMIPGYYLLFLVSDAGVPSVGRFVRVPATTEDAQPPSAPSGLAAAGGLGQVSLTWTAAADNVAIADYSVHRSTVPGFVPSAATLRATTVSTAFVDAAVVAGTYYYRVIARDAAGNESSPSNEASATASADLQPPTVSVTAPLAGASVSGTVNITATAADNVGVAGVRFMLDGVALGAEDLAAPYAVAWDTTTASAGSHQLTAVARDGAGNTTVSAAIAVVVAVAPVPSGLVVALGFDEGTGTTAADRSGLANNATLSNTTWTASGRFGAALAFNGTTSWATVADADALDLTNTMTLSAWVRPTSITSDYRTIVLKENAPGLAYGLYATDGASRPPAGYINTGGTDVAAVAPANLALNTWTHLAVTYDGSALQIYVNGTLVRTTSNTGAIQTSTGALRIGGNSVWGEYFAGTIDEVRVYNRALSATEIQADMTRAVNP